MLRYVRICCALLLATTALPTTVRAEVDPAVLQAETDRVEVLQRACKATVAVFASSGQGGGSGVLISADGYALSNFHVTKEAGDAMKCGLDDGVLYDAVIVGFDPVGDVALLKLLGRDDFPYAPLSNSDRVRTGDWCFAVGNPFLLATDFHPTVSYGVISGVHRYQYPAGTLLEYADCLQADAAINPGNSGGPLFNARGELIGVNGRGSFEKRGRVNVGVGYAISINQIKNFLGHLKSGRILDHATLGARMASDEKHRIVVEDILEDSDAYRRGLRYGDEIVAFGGRPVSTVNAFKNVLGIFPKGWRVPLTYRREGENFDILVRLSGVHRDAELLAMAQGQPQKMPEEKPKRPGDNKPEKPQDPQRPPKPAPPHHAAAPPKPMPEVVKKVFAAKPGYANYFFNAQNQDRVWQAAMARGNFLALAGAWELSGKLASGEEFTLDLDDAATHIKLPGGELKVDMMAELSEAVEPQGSGGLLAALGLWRRLLTVGPSKFGQVVYVGTEPLPGHEGLCDVLLATHGGVQSRIFFDPTDGQMLAWEMTADDDSDPCEMVFMQYQEYEGRVLPSRIEVRHGDSVYAILGVAKFVLQPTPEK